MLGLNFVERKRQEAGRVLFALVESSDELADVEFIQWLLFKDEMTEKEYQDYWGKKHVNHFNLLNYGKSKGKQTVLAQALLLKPSEGSKDNLSLRLMTRHFCSGFYVGHVTLPTIKSTCINKLPPEGEIMYPIDRAILKTIYQIDGISEMKKERALEEVMDKLLSDYGVQ